MATADDIQAGDDDGDDDELAPVAPANQARAKPLPARPVATAARSYRAIKIGSFIGFVLLGWLFILAQNKLHLTAPVVFVCLGFLAVTTTVLNLWRTGAAAAAPDAADREGEWARPLGAAAHLEKEKRTLLKAIKEAEFDLAMGKLSQADCDGLIRDYRARAIEVIKELDRVDQTASPAALSTRDQIAREVKARLALDEQNKPSNRAKNAAAKRAGKGRASPAAAEVASGADSKSAAGEPS